MNADINVGIDECSSNGVLDWMNTAINVGL